MKGLGLDLLRLAVRSATKHNEKPQAESPRRPRPTARPRLPRKTSDSDGGFERHLDAGKPRGAGRASRQRRRANLELALLAVAIAAFVFAAVRPTAGHTIDAPGDAADPESSAPGGVHHGLRRRRPS